MLPSEAGDISRLRGVNLKDEDVLILRISQIFDFYLGAGGVMIVVSKAVLVIGCVLLWWKSQAWVAKYMDASQGEIVDRLHQWTSRCHQFFLNNKKASKRLLISSSAVIDILGLALIFKTLFGPSLKPLIGLVILFGLRQLNQLMTGLPAPKGMIWYHPGVPSIFVTYEVSNDLFFSGHTALAVFSAMQLLDWGLPGIILAVAIILFEAGAMIVLRAHWTMDVFAGAVTALWVNNLADSLSPLVDAGFASLFLK